MTNDLTAIEAVLQTCFDGLHGWKIVSKTFHTDTH